MKIGILQTGHAPAELTQETGDYDKIFAALLDGHGFEFQNFAVVDGIFPDSAQDADGWLITGSRHGAYEDHDWIPPLEDLIRQISAQKKPLIGVCFGHQIIAKALGGHVEKFKGGWVVGPTEYQMNGRSYTVNAWHQDQVTALPQGARVLGENTFCRNAMLAYGDTIWTIQAHPEFTNDFVDGLIRHRGRGVVTDDVLDAAQSRLDARLDSPDIVTHMAEFYKKARA